MRTLFIVLFLLVSSLGYSQNRELYHRVKIETGKDGLQKLARAGIAVDHGTHKKGVYFITDLSESEIESVRQTGLKYTVLIEDMSTYYRKRNEKKAPETRKNLQARVIAPIVEPTQHHSTSSWEPWAAFLPTRKC